MDEGFKPGSSGTDYGSATTKPCVILLKYYGVDIIYLELQRLNSKNSKKMGFFVRYLGFPGVLGIPGYRPVTNTLTTTIPAFLVSMVVCALPQYA
jgi:hypothetical protein